MRPATVEEAPQQRATEEKGRRLVQRWSYQKSSKHRRIKSTVSTD